MAVFFCYLYKQTLGPCLVPDLGVYVAEGRNFAFSKLASLHTGISTRGS